MMPLQLMLTLFFVAAVHPYASVTPTLHPRQSGAFDYSRALPGPGLQGDTSVTSAARSPLELTRLIERVGSRLGFITLGIVHPKFES